jgi:hypothetical protein
MMENRRKTQRTAEKISVKKSKDFLGGLASLRWHFVLVQDLESPRGLFESSF